MAGSVTWEELRALAGFRAAKGCAISLYLNLDPSVSPTERDAETRMKSLLAEGHRLAEARKDQLTRECREGLKADFERLVRWFNNEFARDGTRGVAVFASGPDGLWSTIGVPDPVEDQVKLDVAVYLAPLVRQAADGYEVLVAVVGRERGQVFRLDGGRLVEIADETDEVPGRHDQGGWSQARYERHVEEIVARHLRRVAESLDRAVRGRRGAAIVLVASDQNAADLDDLLSNEVKHAIVGRAQAEAHASAAELYDAAAPVLREWRAGRERDVLERWREATGREGRASAGWQDTLEAASDGRVELLLVQEGANRRAYRCPRDGRAQATGGNCPLDGTPMEERDDGLDLAVHQTLAHGGTVRVIRGRRDLDPVEGIGALLRF